MTLKQKETLVKRSIARHEARGEGLKARHATALLASITAREDAITAHALTVRTRAGVLRTLREGLAGTAIGPWATSIEQEGWRWNVSPFLIAAISGTESTFGAARCGFNAWGINACRGGPYFSSWEEGIAAEAKLLATGYLGQGLTSVYSIGGVYCGHGGGCSSWPYTTASFLTRFGAGPYDVRYPRATNN